MLYVIPAQLYDHNLRPDRRPAVLGANEIRMRVRRALTPKEN